jgi:methionyl-tRNA formyltransferase
MNKPLIHHIFFGTDDFSVGVLDALQENNLAPSFIVTTPDTKKGKGLQLLPPAVKVWSEENQVPYIQVDNLDDESFINKLLSLDMPVYTLASFGKIIPKKLLEIPKHGMLNVHPSLLPKLRGASPLQSAIVSEKTTGVSIMLMDEKMDHGPIVAQENYTENLPVPYSQLQDDLACLGGKLLSKILPHWIQGKIKAVPQNHKKATFTKKIKKADAEIFLDDLPEVKLRKVFAFSAWPRAYFYHRHKDKSLRVIITDAVIDDGVFIPKKLIPEGRKEMDIESFTRGFGDPLV